jgi:hypothetical protein
MNMELREELERLSGKEFLKNLPPNESCTCDWVILPLLRSIGYEHQEIHSRVADGGGKFPDYTILPNVEARLFYLEAKAWFVELQNEHANQSLNYANQNGKRWIVLTNGRNWRLYDNRIEGTAAEKIAAEVRIEDYPHAVLFLEAIGKNSALSGGIEPFASNQRAEKTRLAEEKIRIEAFGVEELHRTNLTPVEEQEDVVDSAPIDRQFWYVNVCEGEHRNWEDNREYGYIGAGQGPRWAQSLKRLQADQRIFAYFKGYGYVGYGRVLRPAVMVKDFTIIGGKNGGKKLLDCKLRVSRAGDNMNNPEKAEWAVAVEWIKTFDRREAKKFKKSDTSPNDKRMFASQQVACTLSKQPETLGFLFKEFSVQQ